MRTIPLCALLTVLRSSAATQSTAPQDSVGQLLQRPAGAPTKLGDLDGTWRRVRIASIRPATGGFTGAISRAYGGEGVQTVFTRGETVSAAGKTFLIAYRTRRVAMDLMSLLANDRGGAPPTFEQVLDMVAPKPTRETPLERVVLDLHSVSRLEEIAPFDLAKATEERPALETGPVMTAAILFPVFAQARLRAREVSSLSNLKQIGLATLMYQQDHDENFPPMKDLATVRSALHPYTKNNDIFVDPLSGLPYHANAYASRRSAATIESPAEFVLFYEATPAPDGTRAVVFADGHARRVPGPEWSRLKRLSHMP